MIVLLAFSLTLITTEKLRAQSNHYSVKDMAIIEQLDKYRGTEGERSVTTSRYDTVKRLILSLHATSNHLDIYMYDFDATGKRTPRTVMTLIRDNGTWGAGGYFDRKHFDDFINEFLEKMKKK